MVGMRPRLLVELFISVIIVSRIPSHGLKIPLLGMALYK